MNCEFTIKLLQQLNRTRKLKNNGFTLIELLVVVIIIGVLAAVALPNFLGQVGKARETEGKNTIGTINRSQQAYHFEKQSFSPTLSDANLAVSNVLGVVVDSKYFTLTTTTAAADQNTSTASSNDGSDGDKDGVRNYSGGIGFNTTNSQFVQVLCQNDTVGTASTPVTAAIIPACPANTTLIR